MKVSTNFDIREFVPRSIWNRWGKDSTWFVSEQVVKLAQFYKDFFTKYYKNKYDDVESVSIVVNTWYYGGTLQYRGFRPPSYTKGAKLSQHRFCNAFDCDIVVKFKDGRKQEADYAEIHDVINEYNGIFMQNGLTAVESVKDAPTWLHSDCRWMPNRTTIKTFKYK